MVPSVTIKIYFSLTAFSSLLGYNSKLLLDTSYFCPFIKYPKFVFVA